VGSIDAPLQPEALSALLARSGGGDRRAFAELYRMTSAKLFGVALRILRRRDWAEEILQESYLNVWNHASDYAASRSAPMTWMTSIVRNRSLDWLRRARCEDAREDYELLAGNLRDEAPDPLERLAQSATASALVRCLERLDEHQRQCIVLAFVHGLSHPELAQQMNQPLGTVKTWIRRALARLRTCLQGAGL